MPSHALIVHLAIALGALVVAFVVAHLTRVWLRVRLNAHLPPNMAMLASELAWVATWMLGLLVVLSTLGYGAAPILGALGVVSLAISLAFQDVSRNLVDGVYLLLENNFQIGEDIEFGGVRGVVNSIGMRVTTLTSPDGESISVPNVQLYSATITNHTVRHESLPGDTGQPPDHPRDPANPGVHLVLSNLLHLPPRRCVPGHATGTESADRRTPVVPERQPPHPQ